MKNNLESNHVSETQLPSGFVFLDDIDPSILVDLRSCTTPIGRRKQLQLLLPGAKIWATRK